MADAVGKKRKGKERKEKKRATTVLPAD